MKLKTTFKLTVAGLAAYGGYTLWSRYGSGRGVADTGRDGARQQSRRIHERAELTAEEWAVGSANPVTQAAAILAESDERTELPRTAEGIERRRSEDTVEP